MQELAMMGMLTIFVLALGLGLLISGIFTAYFGRGKSRMIGVTLAVVGIILGALVALTYEMNWVTYAEGNYLIPLIMNSLRYIGAFLIGAAVSLGIFLFAIMKT